MGAGLESLEGTERTSSEFYTDMLESQCGATDDSEPVEQYQGDLGVTKAFVAAHQRSIGQLQWNDDLADNYTSPGNVSDARWCSGTMIGPNQFLTAGHCFDREADGWRLPNVNGTSEVIPSSEIATRMHVNFEYQVDPTGVLRGEHRVAVKSLIEHRLGGLDFAILELAGAPGDTFGIERLAPSDAGVGTTIAIIGHPAGVPKRIEAGTVLAFDGDRIEYDDIDTLGGNSGSSILRSPDGAIVGVHTNGGCTQGADGANSGMRISRLLEASPVLRTVVVGSKPVSD
jgi:V8-like Glu-specific endopeptidase